MLDDMYDTTEEIPLTESLGAIYEWYGRTEKDRPVAIRGTRSGGHQIRIGTNSEISLPIGENSRTIEGIVVGLLRDGHGKPRLLRLVYPDEKLARY